NRNFFAGGGEEGATVRLYVDDRLVGDTEVEGGRWLVEATGALTGPEQRVHVDMVMPEGDTVVASADVDFFVDLSGDPASDQPARAVSEAGAEPVERSATGDLGQERAEDGPQLEVAALAAGRTAAEAAIASPVIRAVPMQPPETAA